MIRIGVRLRTMLWLLPAGIGIFAFAVLLAGPVHDLLIGWGVLHLDPHDADRMFLKVFRRLLLIPLVALIVIWLRPWRDATPAEFGIRGPTARWQPAVAAFAFTWAFGALLLGGQLAAGWLVFEQPLDPAALPLRFVKYVPIALFVAFFEEWFFRAWLWRRIGAGRFSFRSALSTSLIFAGIHAFRIGVLPGDVSHDARGALEALGGWIQYALDPTAFGPRFLGLLLFALLLSGLYRRHRNLWVAIAVHAGGVSLVHCYGALTERVGGAAWGGGRVLLDGAPVWVGLALLSAWVWRKPTAGSPA